LQEECYSITPSENEAKAISCFDPDSRDGRRYAASAVPPRPALTIALMTLREKNAGSNVTTEVTENTELMMKGAAEWGYPHRGPEGFRTQPAQART
jgi:hypothetical protein